MFAQKTNPAGGWPGGGKLGRGFCGEANFATAANQTQACITCLYYSEAKNRRGIRPLCHLTGREYPYAGMPGCFWKYGDWSEISGDLDLTAAAGNGKVCLPNLARHGDCLINIPSIDENIANNHTAKQSYADYNGRIAYIGRVQRPGTSDGPAASLRPGNVVPCLFLCPKLSEVHHV